MGSLPLCPHANLLSAQAHTVVVQVILKTKAIVKGLVGLLQVV